ncbi:MAG: hypothetical protein QXK95_04925 [Nitrososphaerota archaeon]|nr:hypothetical protein [Candidatus Geocrenenecus dongiae]
MNLKDLFIESFKLALMLTVTPIAVLVLIRILKPEPLWLYIIFWSILVILWTILISLLYLKKR